MKKIDWGKVWKGYDKLWEEHPMGIQVKIIKQRIQSLVEAQLKPKRKRK